MSDNFDIDENQAVTVKLSRLAIIAISLALCGSILAILGFIILREKTQNPTIYFHEIFLVAGFSMLFLALLIGIISLILIHISGGRKTGSNFSVGAIVMSILVCIIIAIPFSLMKVQSIAFRMVCGTNLSDICKGMLLYSNDYDDEFPRAGFPDATLGISINWDAPTRNEAFDITSVANTAIATISSSLFLLIKYFDMDTKTFVCKGDKGISYFEPPDKVDITTLWDFGQQPWKHVSYAYQVPYGEFPLRSVSDPGMAIVADRNPWMSWMNWKAPDFKVFDPFGKRRFQRVGNSPCHQYEGQNVVFLDAHVSFEDVSICGVNKDNIYTSWNGNDISKGMQAFPAIKPAGKSDSLLVNDQPIQRTESRKILFGKNN